MEHNSSTAASSYEVQVCVEVLRVQSELLTNLSEAKFLHFVEVVPSVEHCIVSARSLKKCIVLNDKQSLYLCSMHENLVLESV